MYRAKLSGPSLYLLLTSYPTRKNDVALNKIIKKEFKKKSDNLSVIRNNLVDFNYVKDLWIKKNKLRDIRCLNLEVISIPVYF